MNTVYDFEKYEPPKLNEKKLREEIKRRELRRQILLLRIASLLVTLSIILFAFLISLDSFIIGVLCAVFVCMYLMGNALISVLFFRRQPAFIERSNDI